MTPLCFMDAGAYSSSPQGLLDAYASGMTLCVSRRRRLSAYTGPAWRVRNTSNVEIDIYYRPDHSIDTAALLAHCSGGDGFLVKEYDQSPSANHVGQATASKQPKVVSGTVYQGQSVYDGTDDFAQSASNCGAANAVSIFVCGHRSYQGDALPHVIIENGAPAANPVALFYSEFNLQMQLYVGDGSNYSQTRYSIDLGLNPSGLPTVAAVIADRSQSAAADKAKLFMDGTFVTPAAVDTSGTVGTSSSITPAVWNIGARNGSTYFSRLQTRSIVVFEASKLSDVAAISAALAIT